MKNAIYPGSFDPFTNGHLDIVERALSVFDSITIVVATSPRKQSLIPAEKRVELIQKIFKNNKKVKADVCDGLIVDYAKKSGANALIRGLRAASDFEFEFMMAAMNKRLHPKVETFFMMTGQNLFFISSSMIKELYMFGGDISPYVPTPVATYLTNSKKRGTR